MQAYRKPFFGDRLFPFQIVHKDKKSPEMELPDHLHDRYELVYVYEGQGTFFIDKTLYEKKPGDLFLIPGNTIHRSFPDPEDPIVSTAVFFAPGLAMAESFGDGYSHLRCFEAAKSRKRYKMALPAEMRQTIEMLLDEIQAEIGLQRLGYRQAVLVLLHKLLLEVNRFAAAGWPDEAAEHRIGPAWIREALREIDDGLGRDLGLSRLAKAASVAPSHFSRVFKQYSGMNVTDYVNAKRIIRAKDLLLHTEAGVAEIAERCGFESLPHFHRMFKKLTGVTPKGYRREKNG